VSKLKINNQLGFTIVELLIATAVFSAILLGATFALIQVGKMYYKGIVSARTQEVARNVTDSISRPIQFQGSGVRSNANADEILTSGGLTFSKSVRCVGDQRFTYVIDLQVDASVPSGSISGDKIRHALWLDTMPSAADLCVPVDLTQAQPTAKGSDLLQDHMRLKALEVRQGFTPDLWIIDVGVMYGDRDLIEYSGSIPDRCKGAVSGSQWCALAEYKTQVNKRL